jgi:type II secretion system protein I
MRRSAFTLFEVILALAIMVGAMAVIGELVRGGLTSARRARDLSRATLLAEAKVAQLVAGMQAPDPVTGMVVEDDYTGQFVYSVEVSNTTSPDLLAVRVTVQRYSASDKNPVSCSLVRWMKSPAAIAAEAAATSSAASSTSSSGGL